MERLLEAAVIVAVARRPLQAAVSSRFAHAYPDVATRLRIVLGGVAFVGALMAFFAPPLLGAAAIGAVLVWSTERFRARPRWGIGRQLPPGSLEIFPNTWTDDRCLLDRASRYGPIFKISHFLRPEICVVGLKRGIALLRDHEEALTIPQLPFADFVPGGMLRFMPSPQHEYYRSLFRVAYSAPVFEPHVASFEQRTQCALDAIREQSCAQESGVAPLPFLDQLMMDHWFPLFFAIAPESPQGEELASLYPIIHINNPLKASPRRIRAAVRRIGEIVEEQVSSWRASEPPPCILAHLVASNENAANDPVVIGNLTYILHTSSTDLSALLAWLLKMMSDHPEWLERLAKDPGKALPSDPSSLANRIVAETLRMRQSEFIYRAVREEFEFEGVRFPKGWLVRVCVWESHRDPAVFSHPERFDPDRFLGRTFTRSEYSPFGVESHACLAPQLATTIGSVFVRELARRFHVEARADGPVEFGPYRHWTPSRSFRIRLTERR